MKTTGKPLDSKAALELSRWLDGELGPAEAESLKQRIAADAALHREAELLGALEGMLNQRPELDDAPDVRGAVLARIDRESQEAVGWRILPRSWRMPVWSAAWAACGILLAFFLLGAIELQPLPEDSYGQGEDSGYLVASVETDLSFAEMLDDTLESPGSPVDSMAGWLADPADTETGGATP